MSATAKQAAHVDDVASPQRHRWVELLWGAVPPLAVVLLIGVGLDLVSGGVLAWIRPEEPPTGDWREPVAGVVLISLGVLVALLALRLVERAPYDFNRGETRSPKQCQLLVVALSSMPPRDLAAFDAIVDDVVTRRPDSLRTAVLQIQQQAFANKKRYSWVVPLLAIQYHFESLAGVTTPRRGPLRRLAIVASRQSQPQVENFVTALGILLAGCGYGEGELVLLKRHDPIPVLRDDDHRLLVVDCPRARAGVYAGADFDLIQDSFSVVQELVDDVVAAQSRKFLSLRRPQRLDIAMDFTGGSKQLSVGVALASLVSHAYLQYVSPAEDGSSADVIAYDYGLSERPSINLG